MSDSDYRATDGRGRSVAREIIREIDNLILAAEAETRPLEVDPWRSRLFELFVTAEGANLIPDDRSQGIHEGLDGPTDEQNLSADSLCRLLAQRWGLDMAARESAALQTRLPKEQLERMRLLWSVMRMWMEWSYAWQRWAEFHDEAAETGDDDDDAETDDEAED